MKITVDGKTVFIISPSQKQLFYYHIPEEEFEDDIKRRLRYWIKDKLFKRTLKRIRDLWNKKLQSNNQPTPLDDNEYAKEMFKHPELSHIAMESPMQVSVDDQELFTVAPEEKALIKATYLKKVMDNFIEAELAWIIGEKYRTVKEALCTEYISRELSSGKKREELPSHEDEIIALSLSHPQYKTASQKKTEFIESLTSNN